MATSDALYEATGLEIFDKNQNGDGSPYLSDDWNGDTKNGSGTIDWAADFGLIAACSYEVALVIVTVKDATVGRKLSFKITSDTDTWQAQIRTQVANVPHTEVMLIPERPSYGTTYWETSGSISEVTIRLVGMFRSGVCIE